ncbi:MAG: hypothetical protein M0037_05915 [Betaproteobacteria bacterium]|nr:hypothetical protein [Betaproteobacteria bacterium]
MVNEATAIGRYLIGPVLGVSVAIGVYLSLSLAGAADAKLFAIVPGVALCIAYWASPGMDLCAGLKKLWLFDWVGAVFLPIMVLLMDSQDTVAARLLRSVAMLIFTLSGVVCIRRLIRGKH